MENMPVVIGRYRLSKTLGIGAFGKVKCELEFEDFLFFLPRRTENEQKTCCCLDLEQSQQPTKPSSRLALLHTAFDRV